MIGGRTIRLSTLAVALVSLLGCGDDDPAGPGTPVASIEISPAGLTFRAVGSTEVFTATALGADGAALTGVDVSWSTAGTGVIDVGPGTGIVTSVGDGVDRLIASAGGVDADVPVTVAQDIVGVGHDPSTLRIEVFGSRVALQPFAVDSNGSRIGIPLIFSYESSDPSVVSVDADGVLVANGYGSATISIDLDGLVTTVEAAVESPAFYPPIVGEAVPCVGGAAGPFPCDRVDLLSLLPLDGLGLDRSLGHHAFDLWGWRDPLTDRAYALVGHTLGVTFVDVTDPVSPRVLGLLPSSAGPTTDRGIDVYGNTAYVVAPAGGHGVQVFDLTRLRDVEVFTTFTEDNRWTEIQAATALAVNPSAERLYVTLASGIACGGGLLILDVSTPAEPMFVNCTPGLNARELQCVAYAGPDADYAGRDLCFGPLGRNMAIVDVSSPGVEILGLASYPGSAGPYHGWLTDDQRYFVLADYFDERGDIPDPTRTIVIDVSDIDAPVFAAAFEGPSVALDRNVFVSGDRAYVANQQGGVRVVDISDPTAPAAGGFFDSFPSSESGEELGAYSAYPLLGDNLLLAVGYDEGLFILRSE